MIEAFMSCDDAETSFLTAMMRCEDAGLLDDTLACKMDYSSKTGMMQIRVDKYVTAFGPITREITKDELAWEIAAMVYTLIRQQIPEMN